MPKLSAIRFLDEAILPITLIISAKISSVLIFSLPYSFNWSFDSEVKNRLLIFSFDKFSELVAVSNLSDVSAILVCSIGFAWSIFRSENFRRDLIHPATEAMLHRRSQDKLIVEKEESAHQSSVWFVGSWFLLFIVLNNVLVGITSFFVLGCGIAVIGGLSLAFYNNLTKT